MDGQEFETNVVFGQDLLALTDPVRGWKKRDCYGKLQSYLYGNGYDRVCLLFGLRGTGKTTLLCQAVLDMSPEDVARTACIRATAANTMAEINRDLKKLRNIGCKFVLLEEITLVRDFISSAALLSDIYAAMGMKLVLSGMDSLGFWFALQQELYDRAVTIHTTFIPYREYSALLGTDSIDEYIRYGGTLRTGELDFQNEESAHRYMDTAICRNIQRSILCCEEDDHFRLRWTGSDAKELTGVIERILEDLNRDFLISVLKGDFVSRDLLSAGTLRNEHDPAKRTEILDEANTEAIIEALIDLLEIRNRAAQAAGITKVKVAEIKEYLTALDLIVNCPIETAGPGAEPIEQILFTQPGMRYCQAQALVHVLMRDNRFARLGESERAAICDRILMEVRGRMLEDIVLLETMKAARANQRVFKLQFAAGEFDMVIYDSKQDNCRIFEIKHSDQRVPEQYRHLIDPEKCRQTEHRFGPIAERIVLYRGENGQGDHGVRYQNVEEYLRGLGPVGPAQLKDRLSRR